jgi:hypothetical protein
MKIYSALGTGAVAVAAGLLVGCQSTPLPPGTERGPHGTISYNVLIEASEPGARIEVNGETVGSSPLHIKIFGDKDGTFHDFGSDVYVIRALPVVTNQFVQTRVFGTGRGFGPEDRIPDRVYFDMQQNVPTYAPNGPAYPYPGYAAPYYPYPYYYGPGAYWGPSFRFYYGPGYRYYGNPHLHRHP